MRGTARRRVVVLLYVETGGDVVVRSVASAVSPGNSDVGAMSAMRAHAFAPGDINEKDISILGSLRQTEGERESRRREGAGG